MPKFGEADLRRFYGYPEDMTYEQYAESEKKRAKEILPKDPEGAIEILVKMSNSVMGDSEACSMLGHIYSDGKYVSKDPWKSMLYHVAAMTEESDAESKRIWNALADFRSMLLAMRPMGRLSMNVQDVETACCDRMRNYMIQGSTSISNDDPKDPEFSMSMSKADFKQYLGKEKHEIMGSPTPDTVTPMDLKRCPFCKAPLSLVEMSDDWKQFIRNVF